MSDYDDIMTTADEDRAYDAALDVHNRDAHDFRNPQAEGCIVCEEIAELASEDDDA